MKKTCSAVKIRIEVVGFTFESINGVVTKDAAVSVPFVWKCNRKPAHKGRHRSATGQEW